MKTNLLAAAAALILAALPLQAQTMSTLLPSLTWPETTTVTGSTKGCDAPGATVCILQE